MSEDLSILCTGDIHIGRHPTRIPPAIDDRTFSPKAIWQSTIDAAIDRAVDLVVVTGDVVDRENRYFEAYGAFEDGVHRLDDADIPLVVVAGNHDFDVLARLVDDLDLDTLRLLGEDGTWERWTLDWDGDSPLHVDGWSFPEGHVLTAPFDDYDLPPPADGIHLGVLHADLDSQGSQYAPVKSAELRRSAADAWLLGHIHKPGVHQKSDPLVLYPGSPQPLDPGEPGIHGPWVVSLDTAGVVHTEHLPLASLRYEEFAVDVSGATDPTGIPPRVAEDIRDHVRADVDTSALELLLARIRVTGKTEAHGHIVDQRQAIAEQLDLKAGSLPVQVESLVVDTRPQADLQELSGGDTPVSYLADLLIAIENGDVREERPRLVDAAVDAMQRAHGASAYTHLRREDGTQRPGEDEAIDRLERQARRLLDELIDQKRGTI